MSVDANADSGLNRATLGRQIAEALRRDIIFGALKAGTRLGQQQLCDRFGTSRMPVRDALRQLAYEGFMTSDGRGHSVVATVSRRDIEDTFVIEAMLHSLAARRVAERGDETELRELLGIHEAMQLACRHGDTPRFADLNWAFHRRINQMAASPKLVAALRTLALSMPRDLVSEFPEWASAANEEHQAIVDAMMASDGDAVEQLVRQHVAAAGEDLVRYLENRGVDLS